MSEPTRRSRCTCYFCLVCRQKDEARAVAIVLYTALEMLRRRGLGPEVQAIFDRTQTTKPDWLTLPSWPAENADAL